MASFDDSRPLCECGCGTPTNRAIGDDPRHGIKKGDFFRFVHNHDKRVKGADYEEKDCGYKTPCWVWQKTKGRTHSMPTSYGSLFRDGKAHLAHRWYYEQFVGPIPVGKEVDHLCRNTLCVRPEHLEAVERAVNVQRGKLAKLTPAQVREIREVPELRGQRQRLAKKFGVCTATISRVYNRTAWGNIG